MTGSEIQAEASKEGQEGAVERPGQLIEELHCYGFPPGRTLTGQERRGIVEFAEGFEECGQSTAELEAMDDKDLVATAYWIMADYARGQM